MLMSYDNNEPAYISVVLGSLRECERLVEFVDLETGTLCSISKAPTLETWS